MKKRYDRNTSMPHRRERGVNEHGNAAVGVIEDGVLENGYVRPALVELGTYSRRPAADLGARTPKRVLAAHEPVS